MAMTFAENGERPTKSHFRSARNPPRASLASARLRRYDWRMDFDDDFRARLRDLLV